MALGVTSYSTVIATTKLTRDCTIPRYSHYLFHPMSVPTTFYEQPS